MARKITNVEELTISLKPISIIGEIEKLKARVANVPIDPNRIEDATIARYPCVSPVVFETPIFSRLE